MTVEEILAERQKVHGEFRTHATISQQLKNVVQHAPYNGAPAYAILPAPHREALDMILHKVARILNGDPNHKDHWDDIAGYATLVSKEIDHQRISNLVPQGSPA